MLNVSFPHLESDISFTYTLGILGTPTAMRMTDKDTFLIRHFVHFLLLLRCVIAEVQESELAWSYNHGQWGPEEEETKLQDDEPILQKTVVEKEARD